MKYLPLRDLARLACVNKELRTAYVERVMTRARAIAAVLDSHFRPEFHEGLSAAQTVPPVDLVIHPQVGPST